MSVLIAWNLDVAGLNGSPSVECGRALPIVRRKSDGLYAVFKTVVDPAALAWQSEEEAIAFADAKRWARLQQPIPIPASCVSQDAGQVIRQPMMIHVDSRLLTAAALGARPESYRGEPLQWGTVEGYPDDLSAACGSAENVEALLDQWGTRLKERFDELFGRTSQKESLKSIVNSMLCAARSRRLRWQAYLRLALVQSPETVEQTFRYFTKNEFPDVPWGAFLDQRKALGDVLTKTPSPTSSSLASARSKLQGIANRRPIPVQKRDAA